LLSGKPRERTTAEGRDCGGRDCTVLTTCPLPGRFKETDRKMSARIFSPAKTAMQAGKGRTGLWVLEFEPEQPRRIDPLMGYTSSGDMKSQIRLTFETKEEAIAYAEKNGLAYQVNEPKEAKRRQISYAENFRYDRKIPWTH
jgi:hypothetical protein